MALGSGGSIDTVGAQATGERATALGSVSLASGLRATALVRAPLLRVSKQLP